MQYELPETFQEEMINGQRQSPPRSMSQRLLVMSNISSCLKDPEPNDVDDGAFNKLSETLLQDQAHTWNSLKVETL